MPKGETTGLPPFTPHGQAARCYNARMDIKPILGWGLPEEFIKKLEKALSDYNDLSNEKNKAAALRSVDKQSKGNDQGHDQVT